MTCSCGNNSVILPVGTNGADGVDGTDGSNGVFGGFSGEWSFSASTSSGPSTTEIRLNNSTYGSVTAIYISDTNIDSVSYDAFLDQFSNGGNFGLIRLFKEHDSSVFWMGIVTAVTDNGTDHSITVTYIAHNGTFSASDNVVVTFSPSGTTTNNNIQTETWDTDFTLVAGVDNSHVLIEGSSVPASTSTNRTITLTPGASDSKFSITLGPGLIVGAGHTVTVKDASANTLLTLNEGAQPQRKFEFLYTGSAYKTFEIPASSSAEDLSMDPGYPLGEKKVISAKYDFATDGGSVGTINLGERIPAGAIIDLNDVYFVTNTALTSGGSATVALGYTGNTEAFDSPRPYSVHPYTTANLVANGESYGEGTTSSFAVTINKRSGRIITESLTADPTSVNTITLTNNFITAKSRVFASIGDYGGTGIPVISEIAEGVGACTIKISSQFLGDADADADIDLNDVTLSTLDSVAVVKFFVVDDRVSKDLVKLSSAANVTITISGAALTAGNFDIFIPYRLTS